MEERSGEEIRREERDRNGGREKRCIVQVYLLSTTPHVTTPPHQHFIGRPAHGGQDVHALGREVSLGLRPLTLAIAPAGPHDVLSILVLQLDEVTLAETEEG